MAVSLPAVVAKQMLQCNEAVCCNFCLVFSSEGFPKPFAAKYALQARGKQKRQQERRVGQLEKREGRTVVAPSWDVTGLQTAAGKQCTYQSDT